MQERDIHKTVQRSQRHTDYAPPSYCALSLVEDCYKYPPLVQRIDLRGRWIKYCVKSKVTRRDDYKGGMGMSMKQTLASIPLLREDPLLFTACITQCKTLELHSMQKITKHQHITSLRIRPSSSGGKLLSLLTLPLKCHVLHRTD